MVKANKTTITKQTPKRQMKKAAPKTKVSTNKNIKLLQNTRTTRVTSAAKNRRSVVDVCIGIFTKNENKPMYVKKIYSAMRQRHWKTEGKTPQQTISSKLNKDYRFKRVAPNTFQMTEEFYKNRVRTQNQ